MTKQEIAAINEKTIGNREIYRSPNIILWHAAYPSSSDVALAFLKTRYQEVHFRPDPISFRLEENFKATDLWNRESVTTEEIVILAHGYVLLKFHPYKIDF